MNLLCPICHKSIETPQEQDKKNNFFPFCSERCKLLDLGSWLDADYVITSKNQPEELNPTSENYIPYPENQ
jgi:endogenous inhibitor of DNA gyrase (YacG/DUF329 family)